MYTSYIGLKFLAHYNQVTGNQYDAATFFDQVMFPVFFDNPRHLMHVSNSPFFQNPAAARIQTSGLTKSRLQYQDLVTKISKVAADPPEPPDASIYVGYAANGPDQTTAGQVTSLGLSITADDIYASWIGNALAARVEGSQCLLFERMDICWHIYQGWQVYRDYISPVAGMEGRQIETWNGYWLASGDTNTNPNPPIKNGKLDTVSWVEVLAKLTEWHPDEILPAYIFSLGQTNTTYGFINLHLHQIQRMKEAKFELKRRLMDDNGNDLFWKTYASSYSLYTACQQGEIGLRALKPRDFAKLMEGPFTPLKINPKNQNSFFHIQVWIIAMLNNKTELQVLAAALAAELVAAESTGPGAKRGKTSDSAEAKALFDAKGLVKFIEALTEFIDNRTSHTTLEVIRQVVDQSIRIPAEQFPLFKALIRFEYIMAKNTQPA